MKQSGTEPWEQNKEILRQAGQRRGRLTIFFSYAMGAGKSHAMLQAAHTAKTRGRDVVAGCVETRGWPRTAALLNGLEQIPGRSAGSAAEGRAELDLDGVIHRMPDLLLVDDLAYVNAPGGRHERRFQDVEEILNAGIDVYTTVNVQQIESLSDQVAAITGSMEPNRISDRVFDNAAHVEWIDSKPQDLIRRREREENASYAAGQDKMEAYGLDDLIALRKLARHRYEEWNELAAHKKPAGTGLADEHILVCLSSSPSNQKIIRTAARMAQAFRGTLSAIFVETPDYQAMGQENKDRLRANMHLARQLGAAVETTYGDDVAFQISEFARLSGVSKIVVGRSNLRKKNIFHRPPLVEQLIAYAPSLDIYIIPDREAAVYRERKARREPEKFQVLDLVKSVLVLAAATLIGFLFFFLGFSEANIITVYILGVLITAVATTHRAYSLISSVVSVLVFNFFFTVPRYTLNAYDAGYPATFLIMFTAAFLTGTLAEKIKQHARQSAQTAYRTKVLLDTNQLLQKAKERSSIISVTASQLLKLLGRDIVFYAAESGELKQPSVFRVSENGDGIDYTTDQERQAAQWVYQNNRHAGAATGTFSDARCFYLAVRLNNNVHGVVGIALGMPMDAFENSIVLSILGECALALESEQAARDKAEAAMLAQQEQLRANLLRSISHDLRTPLTSISGSAGVLLSNEDALDKEKRLQLYRDIYDDSLWLISLVENLLAVTRIENGSMGLKMNTELIDEVIAEALHHLGRTSAEHDISFRPADGFLLAKMDARLIVQVVVNIVDNAVKYTPKGSHIIISTEEAEGAVAVEITDNGPGIPDEAKPRIFDMFYTAATKIADSRRSLGLGLALCKSIVNAHGGDISVRDHSPHGTVFRFTLPAEEVRIHE